MATRFERSQDFSAAGEVVEIFEAGGERRARIVLPQPTVIDVGTGRLGDVQLGDRVVVDGAIRIDAVRTCTGPATASRHRGGREG